MFSFRSMPPIYTPALLAAREKIAAAFKAAEEGREIPWEPRTDGKTVIGDETLEELFERLQLKQYCDAFNEEGWDDPDIIKTLEDDEFEKLCLEDFKMKKGHYRKLKMWKEEDESLNKSVLPVAGAGA